MARVVLDHSAAPRGTLTVKQLTVRQDLSIEDAGSISQTCRNKLGNVTSQGIGSTVGFRSVKISFVGQTIDSFMQLLKDRSVTRRTVSKFTDATALC